MTEKPDVRSASIEEIMEWIEEAPKFGGQEIDRYILMLTESITERNRLLESRVMVLFNEKPDR